MLPCSIKMKARLMFLVLCASSIELVSSSCASCATEEIIQNRLSEVKRLILDKLHMRAPPKISKEELEMMNLNDIKDIFYQSDTEEMMQGDQPREDTYLRNINSEDPEYLYGQYYAKKEKMLLYPEESDVAILKAAQSAPIGDQFAMFKIKREWTKSLIDGQYNIFLYCKLLENPESKFQMNVLEYDETTQRVHKHANKSVYYLKQFRHPECFDEKGDLIPHRSFHYKIDVMDKVKEWTKDNYYGFYIEAWSAFGDPMRRESWRSINIDFSFNKKTRPFLYLNIEDDRNRRRKRSEPETYICQTKDLHTYKFCCRYPYQIVFEDFGWDWIIEPRKYKINFCAGVCDFSKVAYRAVYRASASNFSSCCAPKSLRPMSMIYVGDDKNIHYSLVPDMIVDSCACI